MKMQDNHYSSEQEFMHYFSLYMCINTVWYNFINKGYIFVPECKSLLLAVWCNTGLNRYLKNNKKKYNIELILLT